MAIGLRNPFFLKQTEERQGNRAIPFLHIFGHEKTWGKPEPHDYKKMVEAYESWAFACAWKNSTSLASVGCKLFKKTSTENSQDMDEIVSHPLLDLLNNVNAFSNKFELMTITQIFLELTGNAYWWIPRDIFGVPFMIWNIPSHWTKIVPSKTKYIDGYRVQAPGMGRPVAFDETEVIHFKFPSPFSLFYGTSPLLASKYAFDLNKHIKTWGINFFMNNAQPSGILSTESSLGEQEYKRIRDEWNLKYRGTKNAGKIAILESGLKFQQMGSDIKGARFEMVTKDIRNEILAMFGVPPSKLGLVEDVNRANAEANDFTYQKETIVPRLRLIEEKFNEKLVPMYPQDEGVKLVFQFDNPVPEDKQFRLQEKQVNIQTGVTTIDEERAKEGLDPFDLPETSKPLIPFNLTPAGEEKPEFEPFGGEEGQEDEKDEKSVVKGHSRKWRAFVNATRPYDRNLTSSMERFFQEQHSEVMKRLASFRSVQKDLASHILFSFKEQNEKLKNRTKQTVKGAYTTGLVLGATDVDLDLDFDLIDTRVELAIDTRLRWFAENVNSSTADLVKNAINDGLEEGEGIEGIARRIDQVYNHSRDFRSRRIAQTEVIGAANSGQLDSYKQAGVTKKQWVTAGDERVRPSHRGIKIVNLEDYFVTGEGNQLLYPGDRSSSAPAKEVINCRCTLVPIV